MRHLVTIVSTAGALISNRVGEQESGTTIDRSGSTRSTGLTKAWNPLTICSRPTGSNCCPAPRVSRMIDFHVGRQFPFGQR